MDNELTVRSTEVGLALPPEVVLENAKLAAKALVTVLSQKKKPVMMNGEQYLEFEDWQTAGQFYGYTVRTGDAVLVEIDGVKGAKAHADLIDVKTGLVLGGAEAYCMRDEEKWNTRPKYEWQGEDKDARRVKVSDEPVPWFQLASMAQTRAGAKAFRNRLAWVVVLAGYKPTPAEEMTERTVSEAVQERRTIDKSEHFCTVHNFNFFKKGRMKEYAHPIDGTEPQQWCNESPKTEQGGTQQAAVTTKQEESVITDETEGTGINLQFLRDAYKKMEWAGDGTAIAWICNRFAFKRETNMTLKSVILKLNQAQKVEFVDFVSKAAAK